MDIRDWYHLDQYYSRLLGDIYDQPPDPIHTKLAKTVIEMWFPPRSDGPSVLDLGCGQGFCAEIFQARGYSYSGVTLGNDYDVALSAGIPVYLYDMNFLPFLDESFTYLFSRHSLEHSPFPVLTLMEWYRVSREWLCLVLPRPQFWHRYGRNHYSVMSDKQATFLLNRSGWRVVATDHSHKMEYRYLCQKVVPFAIVDNINPHVDEIDQRLLDKDEDDAAVLVDMPVFPDSDVVGNIQEMEYAS